MQDDCTRVWAFPGTTDMSALAARVVMFDTSVTKTPGRCAAAESARVLFELGLVRGSGRHNSVVVTSRPDVWLDYACCMPG